MKPFVLFTFLIWLTSPCLCIRFARSKNHACDPSNSNWTPYNGYRVQKEITWDVKTQRSYHNMVITACRFGKYDYEIITPVNWYDDVQWNSTICNEQQACFRLARRKLYSRRELVVYMAGTVVGALFSCSGQDMSCSAQLPLIADSRLYSWLQWTDWSTLLSLRIPLLHTPDVLDRSYPRSDRWAHRINVLENYSPEDGKTGDINREASWHVAADSMVSLVRTNLISQGPPE
jgi:hypothetical protein